MTWPTRPRRTDRGAVTAELALTLPILVAVTIGLVWLLAVGAAQVRVVDAARETARAVARGDSTAEAVARGQQVAPPGSTVTVSRQDGRVVAVASGRVDGPGGLFGFLPGVEVRAEAVTLDEDEVGQ
ncbi:TadE-like protein [Nocardioides szechwanensis]|uniref:TadE-like protein n=1 Tax=Nocardioides szechwanensis TaxID=1005944 RepID=A0A1H0CDP4_9ACTN|nr:TadE family protein [Nocardioides szechwanensis]SDN56028.1 TadE-like protein [Nocardioides szechwanensis]